MRGISLLGLLESKTVAPAMETLQRFFERYKVPLRFKEGDDDKLRRLLEEHRDGFSRQNLLDRDMGFREVSEFFSEKFAARTQR